MPPKERRSDRPSVMKNFRLSEPHLGMLSYLTTIYGTEAAVVRIAIEEMYKRKRALVGDSLDQKEQVNDEAAA